MVVVGKKWLWFLSFLHGFNALHSLPYHKKIPKDGKLPFNGLQHLCSVAPSTRSHTEMCYRSQCVVDLLLQLSWTSSVKLEEVKSFLHFHISNLANKVKTSCSSLRADAIMVAAGRWKINFFVSTSRIPCSTQITLPRTLTFYYRKCFQALEQAGSSQLPQTCWGIKASK